MLGKLGALAILGVIAALVFQAAARCRKPSGSRAGRVRARSGRAHPRELPGGALRSRVRDRRGAVPAPARGAHADAGVDDRRGTRDRLGVARDAAVRRLARGSRARVRGAGSPCARSAAIQALLATRPATPTVRVVGRFATHQLMLVDPSLTRTAAAQVDGFAAADRRGAVVRRSAARLRRAPRARARRKPRRRWHPARELEDRNAAAVGEMLGDESAVLEAARKTDINFSQVDRVLHAARTWRHRLQSEAEQTSAIGALVDRVELKSDGIRVSIKLPIAGAEKSRAQLPDQVAIARSFPMQLKRRGVELRLIVGDHNRSAAIVDLSLLKAVARAHRWFDEISTGKARSSSLDRCARGTSRPLRRPPDPLGFPAPEIVESIVEGQSSRPLLPQKHSPGASSFRSHGARREPL